MATEQFANFAQTTLLSPITSTQTTINVTSAGPFPSGPQFRIQIGSEILLVVGLSGTTWTVATRPIENTTAAAHSSGDLVTQVLTAGVMANLVAGVVSTFPLVAEGRLTLESGVAVSALDQIGMSTIYWTPFEGDRIALYDGTEWQLYSTAEISLGLGTLTNNTLYDVYIYANASVPTIDTFVAWTNSGQAVTGATNATPIVITANAHGMSNGDLVYISGVTGNTAANGVWTVAGVTANTFQLSGSTGNAAYNSGTGYLAGRAGGTVPVLMNGVWVQTGNSTRRLVGTFRTTATTTTEDSAARRFVANVDQPVSRRIENCPGYNDNNAATSYTTASTTFAGANGGTGNLTEFVVSQPNTAARVSMGSLGTSSATGAYLAGIGVDSTTTPSAVGDISQLSVTANIFAETGGMFFPGYHFFALLVRSSAGTATIFADLGRGGGATDPRATYLEGTVHV